MVRLYLKLYHCHFHLSIYILQKIKLFSNRFTNVRKEGCRIRKPFIHVMVKTLFSMRLCVETGIRNMHV